MEHKRMTFVATPDVEALMDEAKRIFYNKNQSEMIRTLLVAGLNAVEDGGTVSSEDSVSDYFARVQ